MAWTQNNLMAPDDMTPYEDAPAPYEYRRDGWPLCPGCGEDELADLRVAIKADPAAELRCYVCGWAGTIPGCVRINFTRTGTTFPTWVGDAFPGELDARGIVVTCPYCDNLGRVGGCPACGKVKR